MSDTRTSKLKSESFPELSAAVHFTVVFPELKTTLFREVPVPVVAPEREYVIDDKLQLSVAEAFHPVPLCT